MTDRDVIDYSKCKPDAPGIIACPICGKPALQRDEPCYVNYIHQETFLVLPVPHITIAEACRKLKGDPKK